MVSPTIYPNLWKIALIFGVALSFVAFILGWIGFGVPDWHAFHRYNGSTQEYFGLWAYCQQPAPLFNTICQRWPTAENQLFNGSRPQFVRTAEGLITTGMILLSLGLVGAIISALLPFLAYLAGAMAFLAFIFLVIGLPIFARQSNNLSDARGDFQYNKRYGFWLIVPTIVLEFLAALLFLLAGLLYQFFGFGTMATSVGGGRRMLGQGNQVISPFGNPYGARMGPYGGAGGFGMNPYPYGGLGAGGAPSMLSHLIRQRIPRYYGPILSSSTLPQPSIYRAMSQQPLSYASPAYLRAGNPVGPPFAPIINLTGQTLVGPVVRTM